MPVKRDPRAQPGDPPYRAYAHIDPARYMQCEVCKCLIFREHGPICGVCQDAAKVAVAQTDA